MHRKGLQGNRQREKFKTVENNAEDDIKGVSEKRKYQRSTRAEARLNTKKNANILLECWTICPFRWIKNRFKCAYCEENFTECDKLRMHIRKCSAQHTIRDIYNKFKEMAIINVDLTEACCKLCSVPLIDINHMRSHIIEHGFSLNTNHPDGVLPFCLNKESWTCVICKERFNNFLKLYEHMNVHYQHYICAICGKGYMTAPRLRKHSEVHITGSFSCNECGRVFSFRAARDHHKTTHAKVPRYECPHCNMRFDGYYDRMSHLNEAHKEKKVSYRCRCCELSFKTSGKRASHMRSIHFPPQRDYLCTYCDWSFTNGYELRRHLVKHTGEKNHHCSVCEKSYPRSKALKVHMKCHLKQEEQKRNQSKTNLDLNELMPSASNKV